MKDEYGSSNKFLVTIRIALPIISMAIIVFLLTDTMTRMDFAGAKNLHLIYERKSDIDHIDNIDSVKSVAKKMIDDEFDNYKNVSTTE